MADCPLLAKNDIIGRRHRHAEAAHSHIDPANIGIAALKLAATSFALAL